jgi:prepilin-type N-terminal cleavage/methylation domain-containing protein
MKEAEGEEEGEGENVSPPRLTAAVPHRKRPDKEMLNPPRRFFLGQIAQHRPAAFTLVELLVVLVVIAVLAALLFPALSTAFENSKRTACISNQRQLMAGINSYATDHDRDMPYPNMGDELDGWLYAAGKKSAPDGVQTGQIWQYIKSEKTYKCPNDSPNAALLANRQQKFSSYVMNQSVCFLTEGKNGEQNVGKTHQFPPNSICLWEQDETPDGTKFIDGSGDPSKSTSLRHGGGMVVVCFDGHAEWLKAEQITEEKAKNGPDYPGNAKQLGGPNRFWANPRTENGKEP